MTSELALGFIGLILLTNTLSSGSFHLKGDLFTRFLGDMTKNLVPSPTELSDPDAARAFAPLTAGTLPLDDNLLGVGRAAVLELELLDDAATPPEAASLASGATDRSLIGANLLFEAMHGDESSLMHVEDRWNA